MEILVQKNEFTKMAVTGARFISPRAQLPILGNVVLKADKTRLYLFATNLEMSFASFISAKIEGEGEVAVPGRLLSELLPNVSGETLQITAQKESLSLTTDGFSSKIAAMNTNDFPKIAYELTDQAFTLPTEFVKTMKKIIFSVGSDDARPILTGLLFLFSKDQLTLVASDGYRLSKVIIPVESELEEKIIIPKNTLSELLKIQNGEKIQFEKKPESQILFGVGNTVLGSRLIEGEFPNFERIIPKSFKTTVSLSKIDLESALARAAVFARDNGNVVKIVVQEQEIVVSAQSPKTGTQESSVAAQVTGDPTEVSFNYRFVEEFLHTVEGETISLKLNDQSSAGVFEDPDAPTLLHLIMPVKA